MILVDIYIPAVNDSYDFMLDENTAIDKIIMEVVEMVAKKMKSNEVKNADKFLLYSMDTQNILRREETFYTSGVTNGSRLLLV